MSELDFLGSILAASASSVVNTRCVQGSTNDVIAHTWQVLDSTAPYQDDRVLLQVVAFPRNVRGYFHSIG